MASKNYKELYLEVKKKYEELKIINNIITHITRFSDLNKVSASAMDMVIKHVGLTSASILIINEQQEELVLYSHVGYPAEYIRNIRFSRYKKGTGLVGLAWEHSTPVYCEDLTQDSRNPRREEMGKAGYKSGVYIPLIFKGTTLGVLELLSKSDKNVTLQDLDFLNTVCLELAIALDYQKSYRDAMAREMELAARIEEIKVMNEIDHLVLYGPESNNKGESSGFLDHLTHIFRRVIPCDKACLYTVDCKREGFILSAGWDCSADREEIIPFEETNLTQVIETGMVISRPDLTLERKLMPFDRRIFERGFLSDIRVPLISRGKPVGVLSLASHRVGGFTPNHLKMAEKLSTQVSIALGNIEAYSNVKELYVSSTEALSSALAEKDAFTKGHSLRVSKLATKVGRTLKLDPYRLNNLMLAALLHDIGKIGIPDNILNKRSELSDKEYSVLKSHPQKSVNILEPIEHLRDILNDVLHHHESYDGSGYPNGFRGNDIPLGARIIKLCDAYDAMTTQRPYRDAMSSKQALKEIKKFSGRQFDPEISGVFLSMLTAD
ncbi:MAG: HD domain-containing phosphohydrolase [Candidatus Brocadiales bacterium]